MVDALKPTEVRVKFLQESQKLYASATTPPWLPYKDAVRLGHTHPIFDSSGVTIAWRWQCASALTIIHQYVTRYIDSNIKQTWVKYLSWKSWIDKHGQIDPIFRNQHIKKIIIRN